MHCKMANDFDCYLHQDNDGTHALKLYDDVLKDNNINWVVILVFYTKEICNNLYYISINIQLESPPYSLDLNPVEMV